LRVVVVVVRIRNSDRCKKLNLGKLIPGICRAVTILHTGLIRLELV
jgi:hypothetical protein